MSHYEGLVQSIDLSQDSLRYSVTGRIWFATIGNVHIQVPESVYNRLLVAYLASQGVTRKTYLELFVPVEQEWKRQCELESAFRADLKQWFVLDIPGVIIRVDK